MACLPPLTNSQGFAFFDYETNGNLNSHRCRVRLSWPYTPADIGDVGTAMLALINLVKACLPTNSRIVGWGTMNNDGTVYHIAALPTPVVGTHTGGTGAEDFYSRTVTFTGKGFPLNASDCAGQTRMVLFVGSAFNFANGQKYIASGVDTALDDVRDFLTGNSIIGADYYGSVGNWRPRYPVQFNASAQRRLGS